MSFGTRVGPIHIPRAFTLSLELEAGPWNSGSLSFPVSEDRACPACLMCHHVDAMTLGTEAAITLCGTERMWVALQNAMGTISDL